MGSVDTKILRKLTPVEPAVFIEKASIDATSQLAKVVFSLNVAPRKISETLKSASVMEKAFDKVLNGNGHLLHDSIYEESSAGLYGAFVKINAPVMTHEEALADKSGMHLVNANVFADEDDNIWEVRKDGNGNSIVVKALVEDISKLISINPNPSMVTASACVEIDAALETASLVTYYDQDSSAFKHAVMLDTSSAYDFEDKKIKKINPTLAIASTGNLTEFDRAFKKIMGDMATASEMSNEQQQRLYDYLDTLYAHSPVFLAAYKSAIDRVTSSY